MPRPVTCPATSAEREVWWFKQVGLALGMPSRESAGGFLRKVMRATFAAGKAAGLAAAGLNPSSGTDVEDVRRCEGCEAPATTADADDVPLCRACAEACVLGTAPAPADGKGA